MYAYANFYLCSFQCYVGSLFDLVANFTHIFNQTWTKKFV